MTLRPATVGRWLFLAFGGLLAITAPQAFASIPTPPGSVLSAPPGDGETDEQAPETDAEVAETPLPVPADLDLLEQVLRQGGVETETPKPSVSRYLGDLSQAVAESLAGWLSSLGNVDEMLATVVRWLLIGLTATLAALLIWRLAQSLIRHRPVRQENPQVEELAPAENLRMDWLAALKARLEAGEAAGALEALWWWLAARLGVEQVEAGCTTRELVLLAERRDLLPAVRHFDRLLYSGQDFATGEVRQLWHRLREHLPEAEESADRLSPIGSEPVAQSPEVAS